MQPDRHSINSKTQKQVALIAFLTVCLIAALKMQPGVATTNPDSANVIKPLSITTVARQQATSPVQSEIDPSVFAIKELRRFDLAIASEVKLFATPQRKTTPKSTEAVAVPVRVQAIYGDHAQSHHAALIGSTIIHPGEQLDDGRRVTRVSPEGVNVSQ